MTVQRLADLSMEYSDRHYENARLENLLMISYSSEKTLKDAEIKNGTLTMKYWSRGEDYAANTVTRLIPLVWEEWNALE